MSDILEDLLPLTRGPNNLRPCLVGPTGGGKTARLFQAADKLKLPVVTLLLSQSPPEDLLGLPKLGKSAFKMVSPSWVKTLTDKPGILFLDEIDKAREETKGAVLTLLWGLTINDQQLHEDTIIVCAMQPEDKTQFLSSETGKALAARFLFVPIEYQWDYVEGRHGIDLSDWPTPEAIPLPISEYPSPRQTDLALSLIAKTDTKELREAIAYGTHPGELAKALLNPTTKVMDPVSLVKILNESKNPVEIIDTLEVSELIALSGPLMHKGKANAIEELIFKVRCDSSDEMVGTMLASIHEYLEGQDLEEPLPDGVETDLSDMLCRVTSRIAEYWMANKEDKDE